MRFDQMAEKLDELTATFCAEVETSLREIVETGTAHYVMLYGWTPGFNDGDPCTHSMNVVVDGWEAWGEADTLIVPDEDDGAVSESIYDSEDDETDIRAAWPLHGTKDSTAPLRNALQKLEGLFEKAWGTDWCAVVYRDADGNVQLRKGSYECGY